jgi:hypothetical protein
MTPRVREILSWYGADSAGTLTNLARLLNHGRLAGTGKLVILPVDQGFEHGPARSFAPNPPAYNPHYHFELAIEAGCNAYAAPLGFLEAGARDFAGEIPLILKTNDNDVLREEKDPNQALTASVQDALRLGCCAVGFTIYPGSAHQLEMYEELSRLCRGGKAQRAHGRHLVLSARVGSEQGWRNSDRRCRLCRSNRGSARGAHHQGEAADGAYRAGCSPQSIRRAAHSDRDPRGASPSRR